MIRRLILILAPLAALAACDPAEAPSEPASAPTAQVELPAEPGGRFTPYTGGPLALDEYAVGPVMAQTPFTAEAIQARFPKAEVKATKSAITVVQDGVVLLEIAGEPGVTNVGDIRVFSRPAAGPRGEAQGMKWPLLEVAPKRCSMGKDRDRHAVICTQPGEPVLRYVFEVPGWTSDALPPVEVLNKATLRGFIWRSGAGSYYPDSVAR